MASNIQLDGSDGNPQACSCVEAFSEEVGGLFLFVLFKGSSVDEQVLADGPPSLSSFAVLIR
ncbi:MAG: hypothetical protein GC181_00845 [Bacteroidetes bacterium]|nr:hypothetical protein [Bacteroidota bacterium]